MKKERTMNNKGFSLVELIIVIAIMAILIGVMAPQLTKYVERARESSDVQVADTVKQAVTTAMLDPAVEDAPTSFTGSLSKLMTDYPTTTAFGKAVSETLNGESATDVNGRLKSKKYKPASGGDAFTIAISASSVTVTMNTTDGSAALVIK